MKIYSKNFLSEVSRFYNYSTGRFPFSNSTLRSAKVFFMQQFFPKNVPLKASLSEGGGTVQQRPIQALHNVILQAESNLRISRAVTVGVLPQRGSLSVAESTIIKIVFYISASFPLVKSVILWYNYNMK
jgi:hypothetical protein